jgi:hypothetical protein
MMEICVKIKLTSYGCGRFFVVRFVDDLAGAIYDVLKFIIKAIGFLLAGMIIVAIPMYLIVWLFGMFQ